MGFPRVTKSGSRPQARVQPPGPAEMVWVSSMTSSVPCLRVSARSAAWKPGSGRTMPMLVMAGSASTQATSPVASSLSRASRSLNSTTRVVTAGFTGGPMLPGRGPTRPSGPSVAKVSSTVPW